LAAISRRMRHCTEKSMNTMTKLARGLIGQLKPARLEQPAAAVIELPIPDRSNDEPLAEALAERRSRRDFRPEPPVGKQLPGAIRAQSLLLLCYAALAAGCATAPFGASDANLELARSQAAYGSSVFELQCAGCHGPRGEGRGGVPAILGDGALARYPRMDSTYVSSYSGADGQHPVRQAPAPELGRPEFVTAQSLQTYLFHHMPKIKREPLTEQDYWAVVSFMLVAHGLEVPADGISRDNGTKVAINPR
jgi:mono/diheme cytochrome c family protein